MKANYEEDKVIVSATEPTGVNRKKVWIKKGKNLVNVSQIILGHALWSTDGTTLIHEERGYFDYILVNSNTEYSISNCATTAICFYDKNKSFISAVTGKTAFTTPSDCTYIRFAINITKEYSNIQLEQNTVATTYEAYVEPEIYILNNNNVYEKFEKNEERILFESSDGISGNITLTDNITNYSYLEIYYKQNDGTYGYTKCVARNNTHIDLTVNHITNNGYANSFSSRTINLYNNAITTLNTNRYISGNITSDNNLSGTTATNNIYIIKVVGYK